MHGPLNVRFLKVLLTTHSICLCPLSEAIYAQRDITLQQMNKPETQSLQYAQHLHQHDKLHFTSTLCLKVSWTYKESCLDAWQKQDSFLFSKPYRTNMGLTQGLIHFPLSQAVNQPQCEGDHLRYPHNAEVGNGWQYISTPLIPCI